jgi:hypothetical protein
MGKVAGVVLAGSVLGIFAVGCSSSSSSNDPFGGSPDFGSIQQQFQHPTGTFSGKETQTFNAYATQQSNSGDALGGFSLGSGGTTSAQSHLNMRLQSSGIHLESGVSCNFNSESGSCNCPAGGTIQYDLTGMKQYADVEQKGGTIDATVKFKANNCANTDGESIDGTLFENFRGTVPPAGTAPTSGPNNFAIIVDAHMTAVTKAKGTIHADIDLEFSYDNGNYTEKFLVKVDDGTVSVAGNWDSTTKTGSLTITDKNGTTTCTASDGKTAVCKGPDGTSRTVNL